jgi:hypothetical protein
MQAVTGCWNYIYYFYQNQKRIITPNGTCQYMKKTTLNVFIIFQALLDLQDSWNKQCESII